MGVDPYKINMATLICLDLRFDIVYSMGVPDWEICSSGCELQIPIVLLISGVGVGGGGGGGACVRLRSTWA